jgi:hypothetical protein
MNENVIKKLDFILDKMVETNWLVTGNDLLQNGFYSDLKDYSLIGKDFKYLLSIFDKMEIGNISLKEDAESIGPDSKSIFFQKEGGFQVYFKNKKKELKKSKKEEDYQKESRTFNIEINKLTKENLILQNKDLKRKVLFGIIGFIIGAIITNLKDIIAFLQVILE